MKTPSLRAVALGVALSLPACAETVDHPEAVPPRAASPLTAKPPRPAPPRPAVRLTGVAGPSWRLRKMPMAELDLRDLRGHVWKLRELDGKVALVNVWATWCGPCTRELPLVQKLHESLRGRTDTIVLSLNIDEFPELARRYAAEHNLTFPVLPAAKYVSDAVGPSVGIPRTWIVGGGLLTAESQGFTEGQGDAWLERARAEIERARDQLGK